MTSEKIGNSYSGWLMLFFCLFVLAISICGIIYFKDISIIAVIVSIPFLVVCLISVNGFFVLQPNEAAVLLLFGDYKGSVKTSGFIWTNPLYSKTIISLRIRNLNSAKLKVNDQRGNPIEIAAVIAWKIDDTAKALFDVEKYDNYVNIQSETAIRHLANLYPYDINESEKVSLLNGGSEIHQALKAELDNRLKVSGVEIIETRLTHLAYAPEIASAMLRRQQAEAIIMARQKIVQGAVGMVDLALKELLNKNVVNLDEEKKAAMVSNLLVVLCGEAEAQPIINTGTLYN